MTEGAAPVGERLTAEDGAQHARAQQLLADAQADLVAMMEALEKARERLTAARGAWQFWADYLGRRYDLQGGDTIAEDGAVRREPRRPGGEG